MQIVLHREAPQSAAFRSLFERQILRPTPERPCQSRGVGPRLRVLASPSGGSKPTDSEEWQTWHHTRGLRTLKSLTSQKKQYSNAQGHPWPFLCWGTTPIWGQHLHISYHFLPYEKFLTNPLGRRGLQSRHCFPCRGLAWNSSSTKLYTMQIKREINKATL